MTMRENMARAMYEGYRARRLIKSPYWNAPWEEQSKTCHEFYLRFIDDALDALMEPTHGMYEALSATDVRWKDQTSQGVWQTYIRAAKEGK